MFLADSAAQELRGNGAGRGVPLRRVVTWAFGTWRRRNVRLKLLGLVGCIGLVGGAAATLVGAAGAAYASSGTTATFTSAQLGSSGSSAEFSEPGAWQMTWSCNCSNFGTTGNFIVFIDGSPNGDFAPNELGMGGSGTDHDTDTGIFNLAVDSECSWSITVSPDSSGVVSGVATFTSAQVGSTGQASRFLEPGPWQMAWSYDCSNFGSSGNFMVFIDGSSNGDFGPNELGMGGSGTDYYSDTGTFSLAVDSECSWSITVSPPPIFSPRPGSARSIAAGANGTVWIVGTNPVAGGFGIYRWTGSGWTAAPGGATTIAVGPDGSPWVTNSTHQIYHRIGNAWIHLPGAATDIAAGANGTVWIVGTNPVAGGFGVYRWTGSGWPAAPGGATTIAVGPDGSPWVTNSTHQIYHRIGNAWIHLPGAATDIAAGANGTVWIVGTNPVAGGFGIYRWTGSGWTALPGGAVTITVLPNGHPWVLNTLHGIYGS